MFSIPAKIVKFGCLDQRAKKLRVLDTGDCDFFIVDCDGAANFLSFNNFLEGNGQDDGAILILSDESGRSPIAMHEKQQYAR